MFLIIFPDCTCGRAIASFYLVKGGNVMQVPSRQKKKKNPLLCSGRGFVVGRFRLRHNDGGGGLCAFATVCFAAKRDTVVFTGSFHRTSPASKQQSWKAPVAENRIVFDRCVAHAAVKFITVVLDASSKVETWLLSCTPVNNYGKRATAY